MVQYYVYKARNATNQVVTGRVQAASLEAAKKVLQQNNLVPISLALPRSWTEYIPFTNRVSLRDKSFFARQVATMTEAGLTLAQSLRLLIRQGKKSRLQSIIISVLNDIQDGFSFSNALAKFPDVFDAVFINIVRSGEATGKLELVLKELADNMEKEVSVRSKIRGALIYPTFILVVMLVIGLIMTTQVIPQLKDVFASTGQALPVSTNILIGLSDLILAYWYFMLAGLVLIIIGLRMYLRSESGSWAWSRLALRLPIVGVIVQEAAMARFSRTLGTLLNSGVPMLEALRLLKETLSNKLHQQAITQVASEVEKGVAMSSPINKSTLFPPIVGQMVAVGEQTGKMDEVMIKLAQYYESELDTRVASLATLIEPIVIVMLGLGVAWLVQAILLPIYQISTSI